MESRPLASNVAFRLVLIFYWFTALRALAFSKSEQSVVRTAELKTRILRQVKDPRNKRKNERQKILEDICELEKLNPNIDPVDTAIDILNGRWSLIGTFPDTANNSPASKLGANDIVGTRALLNIAYKTLYNSARWSWLAGGLAETNDDRQMNARSFQTLKLSTEDNTIYNTVEFSMMGRSGEISVRGEVGKEDSSTLNIVFIDSTIRLIDPPNFFGFEPMLTIPLPRPRGYVTTTYLDQDMRISRGSRNNIFLTVRPRSHFRPTKKK